MAQDEKKATVEVNGRDSKFNVNSHCLLTMSGGTAPSLFHIDLYICDQENLEISGIKNLENTYAVAEQRLGI